MSEIITGGPAFPADAHAVAGMTLRDCFAAKVMPAIYRDLWVDVRAGRIGFIQEDWRDVVALDAYAMADAMLRAREAK